MFLQVFKFGCYLSIPVLMTVFVAGNPGRLEAIIKNVSLSSSIMLVFILSRAMQFTV